MLLREAGFDPRAVPSEVVERHCPGETPEAYVQRNAREKAAWVQARSPHGTVVLGADTVVVLNDVILEKPTDEDDARDMLRRLSGKSHVVMTGVCLLGIAECVFVEKTQVNFSVVDDEAIDGYIATGEPMDKAGAYAIQGGAATMVERIEGSYSNVVGLPMERVVQELSHMNLPESPRGAGLPQSN